MEEIEIWADALAQDNVTIWAGEFARRPCWFTVVVDDYEDGLVMLAEGIMMPPRFEEKQ